MAVNTAQIQNELKPGLYEVAGKYAQIPNQWKKVFKTRKATLRVETKTQMRFTSLASVKTEGSATAADNNVGERFKFNATVFAVGLCYAVTREAIEDNQYKKDFPLANLGLANSFSQYKENAAWDILNNATTYDSTIGGDGVALCSTAHPYDLGTWANKFSTEQDLNESSLLQACTNIIGNFVDEAGLKIQAMAKSNGLVVPVALIPVAERLTKSELRPGTGNNDVNALRSMQGGVRDYVVSNYLTSNYAWFVQSDQDGLIMLERTAFETDSYIDNATQNLIVTGYERYVPTYNDPRCVWGSFPTS